ncbi:c-type cytochrome [Roseospira visakhapatnamensis]|uniref:Cytochrome c556 n=1 Tax=Roseospira visakhapatnamensis TaxID=390880 RepID=A0A7W6RBG0_9PROT|nr:cytochrome c [Roseospira visakhapatnamensis]MBB4265433.1 cytochrome c556 [Roseospira visakhapatnamensis]
MIKTFAAATTAALLLVGMASPATADDDATVAYRQDVMSVAGAGMGALGCFMKGECGLDGKVLARSAKAIALVGELSQDAFKDPAADAMVETTAVPAIWENWDAFSGGLQAMTDAADELAVAAREADKAAMGPLMQKLGGTCKECHDNFRK